MRKYLIFTSTISLIAFWAGVITSDDNILPFTIEEIMTVSFLSVVFLGYIFIEIEFTPDFSISSKRVYKPTYTPVYAQQLLEKSKASLFFKPTIQLIIQLTRSSIATVKNIVKNFKVRKSNKTKEVERKISDMFAETKFQVTSGNQIKPPASTQKNPSSEHDQTLI
jgi:hypothetical protein